MENVECIEKLIADRDISVLSVGTGSLNDICRLASARQAKKLCIFGTAPSMDGFASYSAPIVCGGFKSSYSAKSPEVIIGEYFTQLSKSVLSFPMSSTVILQ